MNELTTDINAMQAEIERLQNQVNDLVLAVQGQHLGLEWVSEKQTRDLLQVSSSSLLRLRKAGEIRASKLAGRVFYNISDINKLLNRNARKI